MPYVHVVDPFTGKAWRHWYVVLFHVENERKEALDVGRRNIVSVWPLDERLLRRKTSVFTAERPSLTGPRTFPFTSRMATGTGSFCVSLRLRYLRGGYLATTYRRSP